MKHGRMLESTEKRNVCRNVKVSIPRTLGFSRALESAICSPPDGSAAYQLLHLSINRQVDHIVPKNDANLTLSTFMFPLNHLYNAFGGGPRNFKSLSSDEIDTRAGAPSPNFYNTPTGGRLSSRQI
ncbi:hypothetical protein TNCV_2541361 [Trichonephila clavipes]|nr:hypothetical protein TNCV_2541361 [Trichonephila clavipes]